VAKRKAGIAPLSWRVNRVEPHPTLRGHFHVAYSVSGRRLMSYQIIKAGDELAAYMRMRELLTRVYGAKGEVFDG
jgi:hypothetical protein